MKQVLSFFRFLGITLIMTFLLLFLTVYGVICEKKDVFSSSYQSLIQDKYRILKQTNEPKLILVGGSNLAFGLNQSMLEEETGYKVASLGLHGGFGQLFPSELAKENINAGDVVLLAYEYTWLEDIGFDHLGTDMVMSGIDHHVSMYKHIPLRKWPSFLGYLFTYANVKNTYQPAQGIYSSQAFDRQSGQMVALRKDPMPYSAEVFGTLDITNPAISEKSVDYLRKYKEYIEKKGARVYFVSVPIVEDALIGEKTNLLRVKELEEELIGIAYLSNPTQYVYPKEWMSDALYHCNSEGEQIRTKMLIDDLKNNGIVLNESHSF